jgi:NADH-quinone oxidoreductase subunit K
MIPLSSYLIFAGVLFSIGLMGIVVNRRSIIHVLMSVEIMLLAANTNFVAFSNYLHNNLGEIFVFFSLAVAAAEAAIGLAIMVAVFRNRQSIALDKLDELKG